MANLRLQTPQSLSLSLRPGSSGVLGSRSPTPADQSPNWARPWHKESQGRKVSNQIESLIALDRKVGSGFFLFCYPASK